MSRRTNTRTTHPRVLFDFTTPLQPTNPYTSLLMDSVRPHAVPLGFNWTQALLGRYDVVHINWPEKLLRSPSRTKTIIKYLLSVLFLCRLTLARVPVVRTVHNLAPHESGPAIELPFLKWFDRLTLARIYLNESPENDYERGVVILHGIFPPTGQDAAGPERRGSSTPSIATFGLLRPFKGIEQLIEAVAELRTPVTLSIAGLADDPAYATLLGRLVANHANMQLTPRFLDDRELDCLISAAALIVFPYRYMYNSGAVILALCRGRHVLIPDTPSSRALRDEVGSRWVTLFSQPLTSEALTHALQAARSGMPSDERPDLSRRRWPELGSLHAQLYRVVSASHRRTRSAKTAASEIRAKLGQNTDFLRHSALNESTTRNVK